MGQRAFAAVAKPRALGRLRRLRLTLPRRLPDKSWAFGARLFVSFGATLVLVGVAGYLLVDRELRSSQIERYAAEQETDAAVFEAKGLQDGTPAVAIREIHEVLETIAQRPGTRDNLEQRSGKIVQGGQGFSLGRPAATIQAATPRALGVRAAAA